MGIRPQAYLICGINNLQVDEDSLEITDPRYTPSNNLPWDELMETSPPLPELDKWDSNYTIKAAIERADGSLKEGYELIQFDPEFGVPSAIGYIIDEGDYSSDILYAFGAIFEQLHESAIVSIPTYNLNSYATYSGREVLRFFSANKPVPELVSFQNDTFVHRTLPDMKSNRYAEMAKNRKVDSRLDRNIKNMLKHIKAVRNNQVPKVFYESMESYLIATEYLLKWAGFDIAREELKLYLYFVWS